MLQQLIVNYLCYGKVMFYFSVAYSFVPCCTPHSSYLK